MCVDCKLAPEAIIDITVNVKYSQNAPPLTQRNICLVGIFNKSTAGQLRERVVAAADSRHPRSSS